MSTAFRQIDSPRWSSQTCRAIGRLRMEPEHLTLRYGLRFSEGRDELGGARYATIAAASGRQFLFVRYADADTPGTAVWTDFNDSPREARADLLASLDATDEEFTWVQEEPR